jgi:hypothetical protein
VRTTGLAAYVAAPVELDLAALRAHAAGALPAAMVPGAWAAVEAIPRTQANKVDLDALPPTVGVGPAGSPSAVEPAGGGAGASYAMELARRLAARAYPIAMVGLLEPITPSLASVCETIDSVGRTLGLRPDPRVAALAGTSETDEVAALAKEVLGGARLPDDLDDIEPQFFEDLKEHYLRWISFLLWSRSVTLAPADFPVVAVVGADGWPAAPLPVDWVVRTLAGDPLSALSAGGAPELRRAVHDALSLPVAG